MRPDEPQGEIFAHAYFFSIFVGSLVCLLVEPGTLYVLPFVLFFSVPAVLILWAIYRKFAEALHRNLFLSCFGTTTVMLLLAGAVLFWMGDYDPHAFFMLPLIVSALLTAIGCTFFALRFRFKFPVRT